VQQACEFIRPQINDVDAVIFTTRERTFIYAPTLVYLQHDPRKWFDEVRVRAEDDIAKVDLCVQYGKVYFLYATSPLKDVLARTDGRGSKRVLVVLTPGEFGLSDRIKPVKTIQSPDGKTMLEVFDLKVDALP
jgi:hypothetical protein